MLIITNICKETIDAHENPCKSRNRHLGRNMQSHLLLQVLIRLCDAPTSKLMANCVLHYSEALLKLKVKVILMK